MQTLLTRTRMTHGFRRMGLMMIGTAAMLVALTSGSAHAATKLLGIDFGAGNVAGSLPEDGFEAYTPSNNANPSTFTYGSISVSVSGQSGYFNRTRTLNDNPRR